MSVDGIISFMNTNKLNDSHPNYLDFENNVQHHLKDILKNLKQCAEDIILTLKNYHVLKVASGSSNNSIALPIIRVERQLQIQKGYKMGVKITYSLPIRINEDFLEKLHPTLRDKYKDIHELTNAKIQTNQDFLKLISTFANRYQNKDQIVGRIR